MNRGDVMNNVDKKFQELKEKISSKTLEEVYQEIKNNYLAIPVSIQDSLEDYFKKFSYWGKLDRKNGMYEELYLRAKSLKEHMNDYSILYNKLQDYRSKKILVAILSNWYQFDFNTLSTSMETNYSHYFDLDLIKCDSKEVFVDLGCYTGDTISSYLNTYGVDCYDKIYGYEVTKESFEKAKEEFKYLSNIYLKNKAVSDKNEVLYFNYSEVDNSANQVVEDGREKIEAVSIDEDILEDVTMIKMDIEGYEEKALEGCRKHIEKEHPKLLISVYHNHEDLYKIPKMIYQMDSSYQFYLRYYGNHIFPKEIVVIAI